MVRTDGAVAPDHNSQLYRRRKRKPRHVPPTPGLAYGAWLAPVGGLPQTVLPPGRTSAPTGGKPGWRWHRRRFRWGGTLRVVARSLVASVRPVPAKRRAVIRINLSIPSSHD